MEKYEFETEDLSYVDIEERVLRYYGLGYPQSSNFNELKEGVNKGLYIQGEGKDITFTAIVGKKPDKGYIVTISPERIS